MADRMTGILTTHVLDVMHGCPAANMQIQLWRIDQVVTNHVVGREPPPRGDREGRNAASASSTPRDFDAEHGSTSRGVDGGISSTRYLLKTVYTTDNGRTASPLLQNEDFLIGRYELVFAVKDYFTALGVALPEPAFLDDVPIRFAIAHADEHYHVPLLVSPWAYSTYRGS